MKISKRIIDTTFRVVVPWLAEVQVDRMQVTGGVLIIGLDGGFIVFMISINPSIKRRKGKGQAQAMMRVSH